MMEKILNIAFILIKIVYYATAITSRYPPYFNGTCMSPSLCPGAILNNLCGGTNKFCVTEATIQSTGLFTLDQILSVASNNRRILSIYKYIIAPNNGMNCNQKSAYLAQLAHESSGLMSGEEIGAESYFDKYENRADLGNTQAGDGRKYRGRGFIQLTGRSNYGSASSALNIDLINKPELAAFPTISGKIAGWYWTQNNLNSFSDGTFYGFSKQTQKINGGLTGLDARTFLLEKTVLKLNCGKIIKGRGDTCTSQVNGIGYCTPLCVPGLENKDYCGCNGKTESGLCPNDPSNVKCCFEKTTTTTAKTTLTASFTYYQNTALNGGWNTYYQYISSNQPVSSQSQCEALCVNNAACKVYQCWNSNRLCNLISYKSGVSVVSSSLFSSLFFPYSGCVSAYRP